MKRMLLVAVIMVTLFIGLSFSTSYALNNDEIADTALLYVDQNGYSCKKFVQKVLSDLGYSLGGGYLDCYSPAENEIDQASATRGDIIQISNDVEPKDECHVHTAIVLENLGDGRFETVHANWCIPFCYKVSVSTWNPSKFAANDSNCPNFSAHFYRLGEVNPLSFNFDKALPQGFTCGYDTQEAREPQYGEWRVHVVNNPPTTNPGIKSPEYASGMMAKGAVIKFSAKVIGNDVPVNAKLYIKHKDGNWNNVVPIGTIGTDHAYHTYTADLSEATGSISIDELEITQFSLELSDGGNGDDEYWYLDWLKIYPQIWDFSDSWGGWSVKQDAKFADFYPPSSPYCLRLNPTGPKPQLLSPKINGIPNEFDKIAIRYSVKKTKSAPDSPPARVYFDTGQGFNSSCYQSSTIYCDGKPQIVSFDIPDDARNAKQILFDLFDCPNDYEGRQIAIDEITLLRCDGTDEKIYRESVCGESLSLGGGNSDFAPDSHKEKFELIEEPQPVHTSSYIFSNSLFCSYIEPKYPNLPVDVKTTFSSGSVYHWFELGNVYTFVQAQVKYYLPDGRMYKSFFWDTTPSPGVDSYYNWVRYWFNVINIDQDGACDDEMSKWEGLWTAKIYVNSGNGFKYVNSSYFTVEYSHHNCGPFTLEVCPSGCNYSSIQSAINASGDGDTIIVHDGTYNGGINYNGKAITIRSENGPENTIINGQNNGSAVTFNSGEDERSVIDGFTVQNGSAVSGGGVYCNHLSSPAINNCIITNNSSTGTENANGGGGIFCDNGSSPKITDCEIVGNSASSQGGGVYVWNSHAVFSSCIINGNSAQYGGGVSSKDSALSMIDCEVRGNSSSSRGGGVHSCDDRNYFFEDFSMNMVNCLITGNLSGSYGGGVYCSNKFLTTIENSTITCNKTSSNVGSGFYCLNGGKTKIANSIIWGNWSSNVPEIYITDISTKEVTYSNIRLPYWEIYPGTGNINADPEFVSKCSYSQVPTTVGDYHLKPGSPCINSGTNFGAPSADLDNRKRPNGFVNDIGVYEVVCVDADNDGYYSTKGCGDSLDCDDTNAQISPAALEVLNGIDDDCNGEVDDGIENTYTYCQDTDNDGYSNGTSLVETIQPDGYKLESELTSTSGDCDDSNPNIHPGVSEICDGIDNNCDGHVDENTPPAKPTGLRITNISPR